MFKVLLTTLSVLYPLAANSSSVYRYIEPCWVHGNPTECVVVDTRTPEGFLHTRNIFNDAHSYTFKSRWNDNVGFVSWDSVSGREYKFPYRAVRDYTSQVSPHLVIMNVSWD